mmetsp:Transcript_18447/g.52258  ORF Transcript_18447/g.52258 Transcript_18447/m.52258 type:complete len:103 (+) Transcript_18447:116-424(+)
MVGPPSYLRSATFENQSGRPVKVSVTFDSGSGGEYAVEAGASAAVEKSIDHGSWQAVDAIKAVEVAGEGGAPVAVEVSTSGVEIHEYVISAEGEGLAVRKKP